MSHRASALLLILLAAVASQVTTLGFVSAYSTDFYFHNSQELSLTIPGFQFGGFQVPPISSGPGSVDARTFGYVSSDQPSSTGTTVTLSSQILISGPESGYAAVVVWLTNPFPLTVTLDGDVSMHVCMSSTDALTSFQASLYFMAIVAYTPATSNTTLLSDYSSSLTLGNALSSSPQEYVAQLHISNHQFQAGDVFLFIAGAASNKQAWQFNIYFDSPSWNSRATIPAGPSLTIPEFTGSGTILATTILLLTSCLVLARSGLRVRKNGAK